MNVLAHHICSPTRGGSTWYISETVARLQLRLTIDGQAKPQFSISSQYLTEGLDRPQGDPEVPVQDINTWVRFLPDGCSTFWLVVETEYQIYRFVQEHAGFISQHTFKGKMRRRDGPGREYHPNDKQKSEHSISPVFRSTTVPTQATMVKNGRERIHDQRGDLPACPDCGQKTRFKQSRPMIV